jgi:hypothetical protein
LIGALFQISVASPKSKLGCYIYGDQVNQNDPVGILLMGGSLLSLLAYFFLVFRSRKSQELEAVKTLSEESPAVALPEPAPSPEPPKVMPLPTPPKPGMAIQVPTPPQILKTPKRTPPFPSLFSKLLKS